jgi:hypothetical protein
MNPIRRVASILAVAAAAGMGLAGTAAHAIPINTPAGDVVEFYNIYLDHYFMARDEEEVANVTNGKAGPGWVRTGHSFLANRPGDFCFFNSCGVPVSRFYGTPGLGPNSHFYTADTAEAEGLKQPGTGWTFEKIAFLVNVPDAAGQCAPGGFYKPVRRLYNNRFMFNDSNHRYVTTDSERDRMVARGWIDEGVRFCAVAAANGPFISYSMQGVGTLKIREQGECANEALNRGACVGVANLPIPTKPIDGPSCAASPDSELIFSTVGNGYCWGFVQSTAATLADAFSKTFVNGLMDSVGVYINTSSKGPSDYSDIAWHYQLGGAANADGTEGRFFPWGSSFFGTEMDLVLRFRGNPRRLLTPDGSYAYVHPTIEFTDARSGHRFLFNVLAYGNAAGGDFVGREATTGKVIVGTTYRDANPYLRSTGDSTAFIPSPFLPGTPIGAFFEFHIDKTEFQRVVAAARQMDPMLSTDVRDYNVDNFRVKAEVVGQGELGFTLSNLSLTLVSR